MNLHTLDTFSYADRGAVTEQPYNQQSTKTRSPFINTLQIFNQRLHTHSTLLELALQLYNRTLEKYKGPRILSLRFALVSQGFSGSTLFNRAHCLMHIAYSHNASQIKHRIKRTSQILINQSYIMWNYIIKVIMICLLLSCYCVRTKHNIQWL